MLNFFAKRKLRRILDKYLISGAVQEVLGGCKLEMLQIQAGRIGFIFTLVRAETAEKLIERVGFVVDVGIEHEANVNDIIGPMVVMTFGILGAAKAPDSRCQLVSHLQDQLGADIKIVHGAADGHYGQFGSESRLAYTFTFPRFDHALASLLRLEFGQAEEFRA